MINSGFLADISPASINYYKLPLAAGLIIFYFYVSLEYLEINRFSLLFLGLWIVPILLAVFLAAMDEPRMRPHQRLSVDVLFQQSLAHHQPELTARAAPGFVGLLVDDVTKIIKAARIGRLAIAQPRLTRLAALPRAGGEAQDFGFHPAAFQRARQNIRADCRDRNGPPAH